MKIVVASGKGGTGKTTVSAALASVWGSPLTVMDLDVEAPNLHLFLNPEIDGRKTATLPVPTIDDSRCTYCRQCSELCQFKAISVLGQAALVFPEMCHGCGACFAICPEGALVRETRELGEIRWGTFGTQKYICGILRIGEAMSPPLMRAVKAEFQKQNGHRATDLIIDAPPGVSCPAVNAVMDSDVIVLVTEPTPFGLYDLKLAHEAFAALKTPMGVVVNRAGVGDGSVNDFCRMEGIPIWSEIPYSRSIAQSYARGRIITEIDSSLRNRFKKLARQIADTANTAGQEAA